MTEYRNNGDGTFTAITNGETTVSNTNGNVASNFDPVTELGVIIRNGTARLYIYGTYAVALIVAGATHVGLASISVHDPAWLTAATAVLTYLGIPVGALAAANTTTPKAGGM